MNINLTLISQSIIMMVFVWFCMKFVWPPIINSIESRRKQIADGLAAGDRAEKALQDARVEADVLVKEARDQASEIVDQGSQRRNQIVDQAKQEAVTERERQVASAEAEIQQQTTQAREELRKQVAMLTVAGAEKLIEKEIDPATHKALLDKLIKEI